MQWIGGEVEGVTPNTPEADRALMQRSFAYLRENPAQFPELLWLKLAAHWSLDVFPYRNPAEGELPRLDYHGNVQPDELKMARSNWAVCRPAIRSRPTPAHCSIRLGGLCISSISGRC